MATVLKWLLICAAMGGCYRPNPAYHIGDGGDGPRPADGRADVPSNADGLASSDLPASDLPPDLAWQDVPASGDDAGADASGPEGLGPDTAVADVSVRDTAMEPSPPDVPADLGPDGPGMLPAPVAYWRLDTTTSSRTPDELGRNPGMLNGATPAAGCAPVTFGNPSCFAFDGTDDYISTGVQGLPGMNQAKSVSVWFWTNQDTSGVLRKTIFTIENLSARQSIHLGLEYGAVAVWRWASASASVAAPGRVSLSAWHHIGYTFDGQTHTLYLDGARLGASSSTLNNVATTELFLGTYHPTDEPSERFRGRIDDVRVYDRALSASQIARLASGQW